MFLIDTNVISETFRRHPNPGVTAFFADKAAPFYLASVTAGELRRGVNMLRHRGDQPAAARLETWLTLVLDEYAGNILPLDTVSAQIWGELCVPDPDHELDKQIAAIALAHDLTVVTRNVADFARTGTRLLNPFTAVPGTAI